MRICIIGCGSPKAAGRQLARALYTGPLFTDALGWAEVQGFDLILILSAYYGLLDLEREVEPYDLVLAELAEPRRLALGAHVRHVLRFRAEGPADLTILAGAPYAELLRPLAGEGWTLREPLAGFTQGARRSWFAARRREAA